jgi:hypothetical protein
MVATPIIRKWRSLGETRGVFVNNCRFRETCDSAVGDGDGTVCGT